MALAGGGRSGRVDLRRDAGGGTASVTEVHDLTTRTLVMGILNRTPDSFYDQGATFALDALLRRAERARRARAPTSSTSAA